MALQERQLGTGHAVLAAREALDGFDGDLFRTLRRPRRSFAPKTLAAMRAARATADVVALGFEAADPGRYGRFDPGTLTQYWRRFVEAKDATSEQLAITTCNSGFDGG